MVELPTVCGSSSLKPEDAPSGFSFCPFGLIAKYLQRIQCVFSKKTFSK
jgi:hypothetical protein